jgi:hypothetical protein
MSELARRLLPPWLAALLLAMALPSAAVAQ